MEKFIRLNRRNWKYLLCGLRNVRANLVEACEILSTGQGETACIRTLETGQIIEHVALRIRAARPEGIYRLYEICGAYYVSDHLPPETPVQQERQTRKARRRSRREGKAREKALQARITTPESCRKERK